MWYKDTAGHMNDIGYENENGGDTKRRSVTANRRNLDMIGYKHDGGFRQTRLLYPGVTVLNCLFWTKAGYKTEVCSAILYVKKYKVNPEVWLVLASVHKKNNMYFSIKRVGWKVFITPSGSLSDF